MASRIEIIKDKVIIKLEESKGDFSTYCSALRVIPVLYIASLKVTKDVVDTFVSIDEALASFEVVKVEASRHICGLDFSADLKIKLFDILESDTFENLLQVSNSHLYKAYTLWKQTPDVK
jgi:hypothetical protein